MSSKIRPTVPPYRLFIGRALSTSALALSALTLFPATGTCASTVSGGSGGESSFQAGGTGGSYSYDPTTGQETPGAGTASDTAGGNGAIRASRASVLPNGAGWGSQGRAGTDVPLNTNGSGGGGGAGSAGAILKDATVPQVSSTSIIGGSGGNGGNSRVDWVDSNSYGAGGGGGAGAHGLIIDGSATLEIGHEWAGGSGGMGGRSNANAAGGSGGNAGDAVHAVNAGRVAITLTADGNISGGTGGTTGTNGYSAQAFQTNSRGGNGGAGVGGSHADLNLSIDNSGYISGGNGGFANPGTSSLAVPGSVQGANGGNGGSAVLVTSSRLLSITNRAGEITGGAGGSGAPSKDAKMAGETAKNGGNAGNGGAGVSAVASERVTVQNQSRIVGGSGGSGGAGGNKVTPQDSGAAGNGGGNGSGGDGIRLLTATAEITNSNGAEIIGGSSLASGTKSTGNTGGQGVTFTPVAADSSMTVVNRGTIKGGDASADHSSLNTTTVYAGGSAITGKNMTITNSGTLTGGQNSDGTTARAVVFNSGSTGKLILESGSVITGGAEVKSGSTVDLELAGDTDGTLGGTGLADYQGFQGLTKRGASLWTINGDIDNGAGSIKTVTLDSGVLGITGTYTQSAAGKMVVQVTPTAAGKMTVTGTAQLAGALQVAYAPGVYQSNKSYTLIQGGTVSGTFDTVTHTGNGGFDAASLGSKVEYTSSNVFLQLGTVSGGQTGGTVTVAPKNDTVFSGAQTTVMNSSRAAQAATFGRVSGVGAGTAGVAGGVSSGGRSGGTVGSGGNGGTDQTGQSQRKSNLTGNLAGSGLMRGLSAGAFGMSESTGLDETGPVAALVEMFEANPQTNGQYGVWARGIGRTATVDGTGTAPGFDSRTLGGLVGLDGPVNDRLTLGLAGGYTQSLTEETGGSEVKTDSPRTMIYGSYALANPRDTDSLLQNTVVDFSVGYGWHKIDSERKIAATGETATGKNTAHEFNTGAQIRRQFDLPDPGIDGVSGLILTPRAGVGYTRLLEGDFTEHGTLANNLSVHERNSNSIRPQVGLALGGVIDIAGIGVNSSLDLAYTHEVASRTPSRFEVGGGSFSQNGTAPSRGELTLGTAFGFDLTESLSATVSYEAIMPTGNTTAHTVETGLRYRF
ncbi:autotransporter family protein [Novispirillum itersonii]|uniref:autotransporter family protein n=1 Tax=Novispirillum itersonii TaxID=189 RepID=UPI0003622680|nr:autotransporter outer membrane beta-barrel domain-containing protein [Novispirillum itersonii]